ncbi:MAG: flagellar protein FlaG [Marinobacter sp.]|uniref:flagellar protein FlaG n=1 Tax=Marinobacter sp. TaxID=50741 RepID=UPI003C36CF43
MNVVNLNSSDSKLMRSGEQTPVRANPSPQNEGSNASAQSGISSADRSVPVQPLQIPDSSAAARLEASAEDQKVQLDSAVTKLNDYVQTVQRDLKFEVNSDLGQTIVRVVDQDTQEVIRQIPDEVALRLAENLQQDEPLTLFNTKA